MPTSLRLEAGFTLDADAVLYKGDCVEFLGSLPDGIARLVVTSPPYNIGKQYERRMKFDDYLAAQARVIKECVRVLADDGSLCWQVGNFVDDSEIIPLDVALWPTFRDLGLKMRNRIIWHFEHGLHCSRRFSGRYETIIWFTKSDRYVFNLDPVRVPQKYPGKKYFKGPKQGQFSCNPLGKNPGDLWIIPNVKHNHIEKTAHPCQFPVELVERLVLSMTNPGDWVLDPYMGVGTAPAAAVRQGRKGMGAEILPEYVELARQRVAAAKDGTLRTRPMDRPVYTPSGKAGGGDSASSSRPVQPKPEAVGEHEDVGALHGHGRARFLKGLVDAADEGFVVRHRHAPSVRVRPGAVVPLYADLGHLGLPRPDDVRSVLANHAETLTRTK